MDRFGSRSRFAPYSTQCRSQLQYIDIGSHKAFDKWKDEYVIDSKHSRHEDLPSSQLPKLESQIMPYQKQLFAVVDTCSLIRNHHEFVNFVTLLRQSYRGLASPLRFVIPIEVVEELDKCNRPSKRRKPQQENKREDNSDQHARWHQLDRDLDYPPVGDILERRGPPRSFMRVIEEELRVFQIILPDFDPGHAIQLPTGNLRQGSDGDNSILGSCRRAQIFIHSVPHHPETRVILVTEDNLFKTKATSFGLPSFRWKEFMAKYRNFGKKNCIETPTVPTRSRLSSIKLSNTSKQRPSNESSIPKLNLSQAQVSRLNPLPPFSVSHEPNNDNYTTRLADVLEPEPIESHFENLFYGKILPTRRESPINKSTIRPTNMRIKKRISNINSRIVSSLLGDDGNSNQNDVCIIKELILVE